MKNRNPNSHVLWLALIGLLCVLSSCTLYDNLNTLAADAKKSYTDATELYAEHKEDADTNKDGTTTPSEWLAYLLAFVTTGGGAIIVRNARSNARKDKWRPTLQPSSRNCRRSALAIVAVVLLAGCATYEAIVTAPESFWTTAEAIVWALCQDIWTVVEWLL